MKIVVITGSPHRHGTSALLADRFIQGAREAGHEIFRFDAAFQDLHPCLGCDRCRQGDKVCVWKDDMTGLNPHLLAADMIVFASPIYYYDWSAHGRSPFFTVLGKRFHHALAKQSAEICKKIFPLVPDQRSKRH